MRTAIAIVLTLACTLFAAGQSAPQANALPALHHIDVTSVDTAVSPCDNFYHYACNKLNAANPIPPDQTFWGVRGLLIDWNRQVLRQVLESNQAASATRTPNEQKIGDFYASCMEQASSKANDLAAVQPLLDRIEGMRDKREIAGVLAVVHKSFGRAWDAGNNQTNAAMFGYGPTPDFNDVGRVVAGVDQGGLGMPGRKFYLDDDEKSKAIREKYVALVETLLKMAGSSEADASRDAATILRVETAMATAQMDNITRRDPAKINNRYTVEKLKQLTPAFDWDAYFSGLGALAVPLYEVSAPEFFRELNRLLGAEDLSTWKVYLRAQVLREAAPTLGNQWRDAAFVLESAFTGQAQQPPDWRRCTVAVDRYLGEALGQVYVAKVFSPETRARAQKMVKNIEAAMGRDIDSVSWMQPATKREAHLKLAGVLDKIGYPDKWIDYSSLTITRQSYPENVERATAFEFKRQLAFIRKPLDRTQWGMTPPTVNAYEDPQSNTINFPAGILQPSMFDPAEDDVVNYGAIGSVVGHELTHDFDDQGRKFDEKGNLRDWWTAKDAKEYEQRGACIAKEYTGPVPGVTGVEQDGRLTQGEDTADNGGIYLALSALAEDLKAQGETLDDKDANGLTNLQRFFIGFANGRCSLIRPEAARTQVLTDPHSLPELRINNVVSNMPEFQQAFGCKSGQPMVHENRCRVW